MSHHAAFALPPEFLDIVVVEDSKPMQTVLRTMISGLRVRRVRVFDDARQAVEAMLADPPNLIVTDWKLPKVSGFRFLKMIRMPAMAPLCTVPAIVVTAHATQRVVDRAMAAGAHIVCVKPLSPATLIDRITWLVGDPRHMVIGPEGTYVVEGVPERVAMRRLRSEALQQFRVEPVAQPIAPGLPAVARVDLFPELPPPDHTGRFAEVVRRSENRGKAAGHRARPSP